MIDQPPALAGMLIVEDPLGRQQLNGTAFALWRDDLAVTAHHCLKPLPVGWGRRVAWHGQSSRRALRSVAHPDADLAVLHLEPGPAAAAPFELGKCPARHSECAIFGYAWDIVPPAAAEPGSQIRRGDLLKTSATGTAFGAAPSCGTDSIGAVLQLDAPPGFSGGPAFATAQPQYALGVTSCSGQSRTPRFLDLDGPPIPPEQETFVVTLADYAGWLAAAAQTSSFEPSDKVSG